MQLDFFWHRFNNLQGEKITKKTRVSSLKGYLVFTPPEA